MRIDTFNMGQNPKVYIHLASQEMQEKEAKHTLYALLILDPERTCCFQSGVENRSGKNDEPAKRGISGMCLPPSKSKSMSSTTVTSLPLFAISCGNYRAYQL